MSSGEGLTLVKTTLLPGQNGVTVVASLPINPSCDVTANIPIPKLNLTMIDNATKNSSDVKVESS